MNLKVVVIVTVRKRSCGKVMFLHLSVSHSVHRTGSGVSVSVHAGIPPPTPTPPGQLGRHPPWQTPPGQTPLCSVHAGIDMATAADGTHPTGMHSCFEDYSNKIQVLADQWCLVSQFAILNTDPVKHFSTPGTRKSCNTVE